MQPDPAVPDTRRRRSAGPLADAPPAPAPTWDDVPAEPWWDEAPPPPDDAPPADGWGAEPWGDDPWGGEDWHPSVGDCVRVILEEEWAHLRYVRRDLALLREAPPASP